MPSKAARPKSAPPHENPPIPVAAAIPKPPADPFLDLASEVASDMLQHGAHEDDMEYLLRGLIQHTFRRKFPGFGDDESVVKNLGGYYTNQAPRWYRKLAKFWPDPKTEPKPAKSKSPSASDLVRSNVRAELWDAFTQFMGNANPEELRLLNDALRNHEMLGGGNVAEYQIPIAEAFTAELGKREYFLHLPSEYEDLVRDYIDLLEAGEKRKAAAAA